MPRATGRTTIKTLAAELGLSVCTINKALTGKPRIGETTRQRVLEAANRLGYQPNRLARTLVRPVLKLGVVYSAAWPSHTQPLMEGVRARLAELSDYRVEAEFVPVADFHDGLAFVKAVRELAASRPAGLILSLGVYPCEQRRWLWEFLAGARLPAVLLGGQVEEEAPTLSCVWHDCRLCGRLAGELLAGLAGPGRPVGVFIGERIHPDHARKLTGFAEAAGEFGLGPVEIGETLDEAERAYPVVRELFARRPEIAGIYIGTENAAGICRYLAESGLAGRVKVVGTGLSEPIRHGLEAGLVQVSLHQHQRLQGRRAVEVLFRFLETGARPTPEVLIAPSVVLRGNLSAAQSQD